MVHTITVKVGELNSSFGTSTIKFTKSNSGNDTEITNKTNKTSKTPITNNNPVATAAMKKTGMPIIIILLALLSALGIIIGKK